MAVDPYKVWANMRLKIWPERYWIMDLPDEAAESAAKAEYKGDVARQSR